MEGLAVPIFLSVFFLILCVSCFYLSPFYYPLIIRFHIFDHSPTNSIPTHPPANLGLTSGHIEATILTSHDQNHRGPLPASFTIPCYLSLFSLSCPACLPFSDLDLHASLSQDSDHNPFLCFVPVGFHPRLC